jgi:hypothetical protein
MTKKIHFEHDIEALKREALSEGRFLQIIDTIKACKPSKDELRQIVKEVTCIERPKSYTIPNLYQVLEHYGATRRRNAARMEIARTRMPI